MSRSLRAFACSLLVSALGAAYLSAGASAAEPIAAFQPVGSLSDGQFAEVGAASPDGMTVAFTNPETDRFVIVDISDPVHPEVTGEFASGGLATSIAITKDGRYAIGVARNSRLETSDDAIVIDLQTREIVRRIEVTSEPDAVEVSPDGDYAAIAIENESSFSTGEMIVIDLRPEDPDDWTTHDVEFSDPAFETPEQLQPEYVDINENNEAALSFQENNAVAMVDLEAAVATADGGVVDVWSAGIASHPSDLIKGGVLRFDQAFSRAREPDAVVWTADNQHLVSADEGENRGSRTWTIFNRDGSIAYDPGSAVETAAAEAGMYNSDRSSGDRSIELEGAAVGIFDDREYAFFVAERADYLSAYDITDPTAPKLVSHSLTGARPETVEVIPGRGLVMVASESGGPALSFYRPTTRSEIDPSEPPVVGDPGITWGGLRGLAAADAYALWAVSDSGTPAPGAVLTAASGNQRMPQILRIDTDSPGRARVTSSVTLVSAGKVPNWTLADVAESPVGSGWWVATQSPSQVVRVAADGTVTQAFALAAGKTASGMAVSADGSKLFVSTLPAGNPPVGNILTLDAATGAVLSTNPIVLPEELGIVDLDSLPNGDLAVAEAHPTFVGRPARLSRISLAGLADGASITARTVVSEIPEAPHGIRQKGSPVSGLAVTPNGSAWTVSPGVGSNSYGGTRLLRSGRPYGQISEAPDLPSLPSETPDPLSVNGPVEGLARGEGRLLATGNFQLAASVPASRLAALRSGDGSQARTLPGADGVVVDIVSDGLGGHYVAGNFTELGGLPRTRVAHLLADGSVDPAFAPEVDGQVNSIGIREGKLYLAGYFDNVAGQPRGGFAALELPAGTLTGTDLNPDADVLTLLATPAGVYVGGSFSQFGGEAHSKIALVKPDGTVDSAFQGSVEGGGLVSGLALGAGRLYAGGQFGSAGGQERIGLAAFDPATGAVDGGFEVEASGGVEEIAFAHNSLYAGGPFFNINGQLGTGKLARLDAVTGAPVPGFGFDSNCPVVSELLVDGDDLYAGTSGMGPDSCKVDGVHPVGLVKLDAITGEDARGFRGGVYQTGVYALARGAGDELLVGGDFTAAGLGRNQTAAYGTGDVSLEGDWIAEAPLRGPVAVGNDRVYGLDGDGQPIALDGVTGQLDNGFDPPTIQGEVKDLQVVGSRLIVAGRHFGAGDVGRNHVLALRLSDGGIDRGFRADANAQVNDVAIEPGSGRLLLGGAFTEVNGDPARRVAAVDPASGELDASFVSTIGPPAVTAGVEVLALAARADRVYAGGSFAVTGTPAAANLAALSSATGAVLGTWSPQPNGPVSAVENAPGAVIASGEFSEIGGAPRTRLAALDPDSGQALDGWAPELDQPATAIEAFGDAIVVGGPFASVGDNSAFANLAAFPIRLPVNIAAPEVQGTPAVGQALTCAEGTWAESPNAFQYSWQRGGATIDGAGARVYTATAADAGHAVRCLVTASNSAGTSPAAESSAVAIPVLSQPTPPVSEPPTRTPIPSPTPPNALPNTKQKSKCAKGEHRKAGAKGCKKKAKKGKCAKGKPKKTAPKGCDKTRNG